MNVYPVWCQGYTGRDVVVSILDDGIEKDHPDIKKNYVCTTDDLSVLLASLSTWSWLQCILVETVFFNEGFVYFFNFLQKQVKYVRITSIIQVHFRTNNCITSITVVRWGVKLYSIQPVSVNCK